MALDLYPAKRRTLVAFRDYLAKMSWSSKRLDQFVPAPGYYVSEGAVYRESDGGLERRFPFLSADGGTVLVSAEDFEPAEAAWRYLAALVKRGDPFPHGFTLGSTISAIDVLVRMADASRAPKAPVMSMIAQPKRPIWPWIAGGVGALGFLGLLVWAARR